MILSCLTSSQSRTDPWPLALTFMPGSCLSVVLRPAMRRNVQRALCTEVWRLHARGKVVELRIVKVAIGMLTNDDYVAESSPRVLSQPA